jgi:N-carbamoylputrescine amidase
MSTLLRVAAVQIESHNGQSAANLARAEPFVRAAAARGACLVLCPEFLAPGYIYDESIWRSGEPAGGATESWLARLAAAHAVFIGATYLEADGDDFYNTFALASPRGDIVGRVRKESLPGFEGWYFKSCERPKYIDCELGRIAVGICHDNHTGAFMRRVASDRPDLILMPHSAPCTPGSVRIMRESLGEIGTFYARALGVPTVLVNKVGAPSRSPIPFLPVVKLPFEFPGLSGIVDSDGAIVDRVVRGEGVAIGDVHLDPARKRSVAPSAGYWSRPPSRYARALAVVMQALDRAGRRAYARSSTRVAAARAVARPSAVPQKGTLEKRSDP